MSATATANPFLAATLGTTRMSLKFYLSDLKAIGEEKLLTCPMGKARTPMDVTIELIGVNFASAAILRGEPSLSEEEAMAKFAGVKTLDEAARLMTESVDAVEAAALTLEESDLQTQVTAPWGAPISKGGLLGFVPLHLMYHDGQLNYFQALHGDTAVHWHD